MAAGRKSLKIAIIINTFPGQSQVFILNMIAGLLDEGHTVDIYSTNINDGQYRHAIVDQYGMMGRVHRYGSKIPQKRWFRVFALLTHLLRYPYSWSAIWKSLFISKPGKLDFFLKYRVFFKKRRYDIIHPQFLRECRMVYRLREVGMLQGKVFTSVRGFDLSHWLSSQKENPLPKMIRNGCRFLPVSEQFKEELVDKGCPADRVHVLPSGMDLSKLDFKPREIIKNRTIKCVSVGRLVEKKGHVYGIRVVQELRVRGYDVEYEVIGDGYLKDKIREEIMKLNAEEWVSLTHALPHDQTIENLHQKDLLLAPHVTAENGDREGIPNSIKEAMALGLPVFATRHSGIPELITDGVNGFLSEEKDVIGMADNIVKVIDNGIVPEILERARKKVVEEYDQHKVTDRLLEIYDSID